MMTKEQFNERMGALQQNEAFMSKLKEAKDEEAVAALFTAEGIEMTAEDVKEFLQILNEEHELTDDELEAVVGGIGLKEIIDVGSKMIGIVYDLRPDGKYGPTIQKGVNWLYNKLTGRK